MARSKRPLLRGLIVVLAGCFFFAGIGWGLPSRLGDSILFPPSHLPWTGKQILALGGAWNDHGGRGSDVAIEHPFDRSHPVVMNATDAERARIVRRFRLYSDQPDEMITFRALSQMRPGKGDFDPRFFQYGGAWVYPVGALLKAASIVGAVQLRSDPAFYLNHPKAFGRFYVIARMYSAAWGLLGALLMFELAVLWTGQTWAGGLAGAIYAMMPVVVNSAHEAKPHLAASVLVLATLWAATKYLLAGRQGRGRNVEGTENREYEIRNPKSEIRNKFENQKSKFETNAKFKSQISNLFLFRYLNFRHWNLFRLSAFGFRISPKGLRIYHGWAWLAAVLAGLAASMVWTGAAAWAVLPVMVWIGPVHRHRWFFALQLVLVAMVVFLLVNPYLPIDLIWRRGVVQSNVGNSTAMYHPVVGWSGLVNSARLIGEAMNPWVAMAAVLSLLGIANVGLARLDRARRGLPAFTRSQRALPAPHSTAPLHPVWLAVVPAILVACQFVLLATGKPAEYARFSLPLDLLLAIAVAAGVSSIRSVHLRVAATVVVLVLVAGSGIVYLWHFCVGTAASTRFIAAEVLANTSGPVYLHAEPAPYCMPAVDLFDRKLVLLPLGSSGEQLVPGVDVRAVDHIAVGAGWLNWLQRDVGWSPDAPITWADKPFVVTLVSGSAHVKVRRVSHEGSRRNTKNRGKKRN